MKKSLICILILFCTGICFAEESNLMVSFETILTATDPVGSEFPGGRGPNQMVLYTPRYGEKTGTNQWGTEAIVDKGRVISVGTNDSPIPEKGFVISGHGTSRDWINANCLPGRKVEVDGLKIKITQDGEALVRKFELEMEKIRKQITEKPPQTSKENQEKISEILSRIYDHPKLMRSILKRKEIEPFESLYKISTGELEKVRQLASYSREEEIRGAWFRLYDGTPEEVRTLVQKLSDAGFNLLLPETIYWGQTIYPHGPIVTDTRIYDAGMVPEAKPSQGWDLFGTLIEEAHKHNMAVHAWVHTFFWGIDENQPILKEKPEWILLDREGRKQSAVEVAGDKGYVFLDPANPEVREFILSMFEDLLKRYPIDGLHLDYIRYPRADKLETQGGYSKYSRETFKKFTGHDPIDITPEDSELWEKWNDWRMGNVSLMVKQVKQLVKKERPGVKISAAVFPDLKEARETKLQDWPTWTQVGYLDYIAFMAYGTDASYVTKIAKESPGSPALGKTPLVMGLAPYLGLSTSQILDQVEGVQGTNSVGYAFFAAQHLSDETLEALKTSVFSKTAWHPALGKKPGD